MATLRPRNIDGFALAEVLIAATLLALGLLGQLALLATGLRAERTANNVATAATLAADLAERLRANASAAASYALDPASPPPSPPACPLAAPLDALTRASCDLEEWQREVASSLPGATASVVSTAVAGGNAVTCAITIRWDAGSAEGGEYTLHVQA